MYFADSGQQVIATSRSINKLQLLEKEVGNLSEKIDFVCQDLMEDNSSSKLRKKIEEKGKCVTQLINNARSLDYLMQNEKGIVDEEKFTNEIRLDVIVPYKLINEFSLGIKHRLNNVVNISSIYGVVVPNLNLYEEGDIGCPINYSVSKSAMNHLTKEMAIRLAKRNIRVNSVAFGGVKGRTSAEFNERYAKYCPSGRMLELNEVVGPVEFLLSAKSSGVTGHVLMVDGGWTVW